MLKTRLKCRKMSSLANNTSPVDDGIVLGGGYLFLITFGGAGLFFVGIMSLVCCSEYKKYRERKPRRPFNIDMGDYPRQPLDVPPVTIPTVNASYPRQTYSSTTPQEQEPTPQRTPEEESDTRGDNPVNSHQAQIHENDHTSPKRPHRLPPINIVDKSPQSAVEDRDMIFSPRVLPQDGAKPNFQDDNADKVKAAEV